MSTLRVTAERLTILDHPNADALELAQVGLYRAVVAIDPNAQPITPRPPHQRRPAADFPANLFPWRHKDDT